MDWAAAEHKVGLDPYRDIGRVRCVFDLVQPGGVASSIRTRTRADRTIA